MMEAIIHVPAGAGKALSVGTDIVTFKLPGGTTAGAFFLAEATVPPQGGAPLHAHVAQETFYILGGDFEIRGRAQVIRASAGSIVHIPSNAPHGYTNVGRSPGRILLMLTPAGKAEQFFEEIGRPLGTDTESPSTPDLHTLLKIMKKYNVTLDDSSPEP